MHLFPCLLQIYDNAMITAGLNDDPRPMISRLNDLLTKALEKHWRLSRTAQTDVVLTEGRCLMRDTTLFFPHAITSHSPLWGPHQGCKSSDVKMNCWKLLCKHFWLCSLWFWYLGVVFHMVCFLKTAADVHTFFWESCFFKSNTGNNIVHHPHAESCGSIPAIVSLKRCIKGEFL